MENGIYWLSFGDSYSHYSIFGHTAKLEIDTSDLTKIYSCPGGGVKYTDCANHEEMWEARIARNLGLSENDIVLSEVGYDWHSGDAVEGNKIVQFGTTDEVLELRDKNALVVDLRGYTVNADQPLGEAFTVKDGKFLKVGSVAEVAKHQGAGGELNDLKGRLVPPGFVDEHLHIDMVAENRMNVAFDPTRSYENFAATIKHFQSRNPVSKWVYVGNLDWLQPNNGRIIT